MLTKHIHLEVPAKQYHFMLKLLAALPFVRVTEPIKTAALTPAQQVTYDNVKQGFAELKLLREGKLKAQPIQEFLDEL